jgi:hypothetical protein
MTLQKFTRQQHVNWPAATVRKNGSLCINRQAIEEFGLQETHFVTLHFDPQNLLLGIKPETDNSDPSVFKVSKEKSHTSVISCQAFLKHCGIPYEEGSRILKINWDDKGKMILVKLPQNHSKEARYE